MHTITSLIHELLTCNVPPSEVEDPEWARATAITKLLFDAPDSELKAKAWLTEQGVSTKFEGNGKPLFTLDQAIQLLYRPELANDLPVRKVVRELFCPPFRYIGGYIWDSNHNMVADAGARTADGTEVKGLMVARIRGWGRLQYLDSPELRASAIQDELGNVLAEALTRFWSS